MWNISDFADDQPAAGLAEFEALAEAAFHRDRRGGEPRHLDTLARQRREPELLDLADVGRMLGRTRRAPPSSAVGIGDVNDVFLVVEDVVRGILVVPRPCGRR